MCTWAVTSFLNIRFFHCPFTYLGNEITLVESLLKELEDHLFFQSVWMVAYLTLSDLLHSCSVLCLECGCHRSLFLYRGHWAVAGHIEVVIAKGSRQRWLLVSNGNVKSSVTSPSVPRSQRCVGPVRTNDQEWPCCPPLPRAPWSLPTLPLARFHFLPRPFPSYSAF